MIDPDVPRYLVLVHRWNALKESGAPADEQREAQRELEAVERLLVARYGFPDAVGLSSACEEWLRRQFPADPGPEDVVH